jgi:hypothetical protein
MTRFVEVEDWVYEELEHRRRVLGYTSLNELLIDYIIRKAPPIALERRVVEGARAIIDNLSFDDEEPVDSVIDEVLFKVADKYGYLVTSIQKLEGTVFEILILRFLDKEGLEYIYRAPQVGYGTVKGSLNAEKLLGMPDIVYGLDGVVKGVIEAKKHEKFHLTEHDRIKLLYFIKKGLKANIITTAPKPRKSEIYNEIVQRGVRVFHVITVSDLKAAVAQLHRELS